MPGLDNGEGRGGLEGSSDPPFCGISIYISIKSDRNGTKTILPLLEFNLKVRWRWLLVLMSQRALWLAKNILQILRFYLKAEQRPHHRQHHQHHFHQPTSTPAGYAPISGMMFDLFTMVNRLNQNVGEAMKNSMIHEGLLRRNNYNNHRKF